MSPEMVPDETGESGADERIDEDGDDDVNEQLARFGEWLRRTHAELDAADGDADELAPIEDQLSLVEAFTALRQEVKLQSKNSRGLEEQSRQLLDGLAQAIQALREAATMDRAASRTAGKSPERPFALLVAEIDEALERGLLQTERVAAQLGQSPGEALAAALADVYQRQSWWTRLWSGAYHRQTLRLTREWRGAEQQRALLQALLDGYRIVQKRVQQALRSEGISRVATVGQPVDPERMVVVEVSEVEDSPGNQVLEELRAGYLWQGRVLRYAEVRASRLKESPSGAGDDGSHSGN